MEYVNQMVLVELASYPKSINLFSSHFKFEFFLSTLLVILDGFNINPMIVEQNSWLLYNDLQADLPAS